MGCEAVPHALRGRALDRKSCGEPSERVATDVERAGSEDFAASRDQFEDAGSIVVIEGNAPRLRLPFVTCDSQHVRDTTTSLLVA